MSPKSVVGNILHLARLIKYKLIYAIRPGITAVGSLASKQASGQSSNMTEADQLISYIHTNYAFGRQTCIYDPQ